MTLQVMLPELNEPQLKMLERHIDSIKVAARISEVIYSVRSLEASPEYASRRIADLQAITEPPMV